MGGSDVSQSRVFFSSNTRSLFRNFATGDFRQIWPWHVNRGWNADFGHKIMKSVHSGVICPQNPKLWGGQTVTSLRAGYRSRDAVRYCLLHIVVQRPESFRGRVMFYYVRLWSYGVSKLPNFRILAYFPRTKRLKSTSRWPAYSPGVTSQNDSDFSLWQSKVQRGPFGSGAFMGLLAGELGTPKRAQIFAYGKWLYTNRMLLHGASDLNQGCLETCNSKDGCTFPPNIFALTPKSPPKNISGTFQCKAYYKSHVNGATKLKSCIYLGIGKYLECIKKISATGVASEGRRAP